MQLIVPYLTWGGRNIGTVVAKKEVPSPKDQALAAAYRGPAHS